MRQTATGWIAALTVLTIGLAGVGEANAQGLEFFPADDEPTSAASSSDDDQELRQRLSGLRQRAGDETTKPAPENEAPTNQQRQQQTAEDELSLPGAHPPQPDAGAPAASGSVGNSPVRSLQSINAVPEGQALNPSLHTAIEAQQLNSWEVCNEETFVSHSPRGSVIDASGERLAQIDSPNWARCVDGVLAVGSDTHHLSTFDARRQRWVHADLQPPENIEITDVQTQKIEGSGPNSQSFLVDARTGTPDRFLGIWQPGQRTVELQRTPFAGIVQARDLGDRIRVVWVDYSERDAGERIVSDMTRQGVQTLHRQTGGELNILEDGWVVSQNGSSGQILTPAGQVRDWEIQGCAGQPTLWRAYAEPAAALMSCRSDQDGVERFKYWTPDDAQIWQMQRHYQRTSSRNQTLMDRDQPVASRIGPDGDDAAGLWFDMIGATMWQGDMLLPAYHWDGEGTPHTLLATDVAAGDEAASAPRSLYVIDTEAGTQQPVAAYEDCPGFLRAVDQTDSAVIVHCLSQDADGAYRFQYHWSEFIDLQSGDWWRTSSKEIQRFGPQGRLIVTNRGAGTDYHWTMGSRLYFTEPMVEAR